MSHVFLDVTDVTLWLFKLHSHGQSLKLVLEVLMILMGKASIYLWAMASTAMLN
jgi:hypothetical protein